VFNNNSQKIRLSRFCQNSVLDHGDDLVEFHELGTATAKARCPNVLR